MRATVAAGGAFSSGDHLDLEPCGGEAAFRVARVGQAERGQAADQSRRNSVSLALCQLPQGGFLVVCEFPSASWLKAPRLDVDLHDQFPDHADCLTRLHAALDCCATWMTTRPAMAADDTLDTRPLRDRLRVESRSVEQARALETYGWARLP